MTTGAVLKKVGLEVGRQLLQEQAVKVMTKELTKGLLKKAVGGEIKKADEIITTRLGSKKVAGQLHNIVAMDLFLGQNNYNQQVQREVGYFLNSRSHELASIAMRFASAAAGTGTVGAVVSTVTSVGSMAISLEEIITIAEDFCAHMESKISEIESSLPSFADLLAKKIPTFDEGKAGSLVSGLKDYDSILFCNRMKMGLLITSLSRISVIMFK